jgi:hypothetical protein
LGELVQGAEQEVIVDGVRVANDWFRSLEMGEVRYATDEREIDYE